MGDEPGVVEALLRRVRPSGWRVAAALPWKNIRKYRAGAANQRADHADAHNVRGLVLHAYEEACEMLAFVRDVDGELLREREGPSSARVDCRPALRRDVRLRARDLGRNTTPQARRLDLVPARSGEHRRDVEDPCRSRSGQDHRPAEVERRLRRLGRDRRAADRRRFAARVAGSRRGDVRPVDRRRTSVKTRSPRVLRGITDPGLLCRSQRRAVPHARAAGA
jgi:hypothetical protein